MQCYAHNQEQAVGICAHCNKGVCQKCIYANSACLACSEACNTAILEKEELNERAKMIYGIGKHASTKNIPFTPMIITLTGFLFVVWGVYEIDRGFELWGFLMSLGALFIIAGALSWLRLKKTGMRL